MENEWSRWSKDRKVNEKEYKRSKVEKSLSMLWSFEEKSCQCDQLNGYMRLLHPHPEIARLDVFITNKGINWD